MDPVDRFFVSFYKLLLEFIPQTENWPTNLMNKKEKKVILRKKFAMKASAHNIHLWK